MHIAHMCAFAPISFSIIENVEFFVEIYCFMYMWPAQSRPFLCLSQTRGANISHMCVCSAQKVPSSPKYRRKSQIRVFAIAHTISINHFVGVMRTYYRNRNDDDLRPLSEQFEKNFYLFSFFSTLLFSSASTCIAIGSTVCFF